MARVVSTKKTGKAKVQTLSNGKRVYGPYKGSKQNHGRPVSPVAEKGQPAKNSQNTAAYNKMKSVGRAGSPVPPGKNVAHVGKTNKAGNKSVSASSTRIESKSKNIGDGNKSRRRST